VALIPMNSHLLDSGGDVGVLYHVFFRGEQISARTVAGESAL